MANSIQRRGCQRVFSILLSYLLAPPGAGPQIMLGQEASNIEILVQSGIDRVNSEVSTWEIAVQVQDNLGRKLKGAAVIFQVPPGAGTFVGGISTLTTVTDDNGRAVAKGFRRGAFVGPFQITITASYRGLSATTAVSQVNPKLAFMQTPQKWWVYGGSVAVIAGAVAGTWSVTHGPNRTRVTLGTGTVSPASTAR